MITGHVKGKHTSTPADESKVAVKSPFYKKKSTLKLERLLEQYSKLQQSGKIDAFMKKRRGKVAKKGRKYVPKERARSAKQ
jgi:hypothetical protein